MEGHFIIDTEGNRLAGVNLTAATVIEDGNFAIGVPYDEQSAKYVQERKELKTNLDNTDYKLLKHMEGVLSDEEWEPVQKQRQAWRDRINELEELIVTPSFTREELDAIEVKALKKMGVQNITVEHGVVQD